MGGEFVLAVLLVLHDLLERAHEGLVGAERGGANVVLDQHVGCRHPHRIRELYRRFIRIIALKTIPSVIVVCVVCACVSCVCCVLCVVRWADLEGESVLGGEEVLRETVGLDFGVDVVVALAHLERTRHLHRVLCSPATNDDEHACQTPRTRPHEGAANAH